MGGRLVPLVALALLLPVATPFPLAAAKREAVVHPDVEIRMGEAKRDEPIPVIVLLDAPERDPASRFRDAGAFAPGHVFERFPFGFSAALTPRQIERFSAKPEVLAIESDEEVRALLSTAIASFGAGKAAADFGATGDGDGDPRSYGPSDAVVCVIDTGIDAGHRDLDGGKVIGWRDLVNQKTAPYDDHGHGTHVAGTVAGTGDANPAYAGVAPGAALVGVKVLNAAGSGSLSTVQAGVEWCVANREALGIEILSLSLGSSGSSDGRDSLSLAVNAAADAGLVVVVAAGNSGPAKRTIGSPGAAAKAVTVGAMSDLGEGGFALASFSSRGPTADGRTKPDLAAPGVSITAPKANSPTAYSTLSGTSMATPFVSGVAALLAARGVPARSIESALLSTAEDWGPAGKDVDYGVGRLRAYDAVRSGLGAAGASLTDPVHRHETGSLAATGRSLFVPVYVASASTPLAITAIHTNSAGVSPDLDLYLYPPGADTSRRSNAVAKSETASRQETIRVAAPNVGVYTLEYYSYTGAPAWFVDTSGALDVLAPTTRATVSGPAGRGGWFTGPVTLSLSATDDLSGVSQSRYRLEPPAGAADVAYAGPVGISRDGALTVTYWSLDRAGNVEAPRTLGVPIDATPPSLSFGVAGPAGDAGWHRGPVTVALAASDATSGLLAPPECDLDGAPAPCGTALSEEGVRVLRARAEDQAGNVGAATATVRIDSAPPDVGIEVACATPGLAEWCRGPVTLATRASDVTSGLASVTCALDATPVDCASDPVRAPGAHLFELTARDAAGNVARATAAFRVDEEAPSASARAEGILGGGGWHRSEVILVVECDDPAPGSGCAGDEIAVGSDRYVPGSRVTLVADGPHGVGYRSVDVAGNVGAEGRLAVAIDRTAPRLVLDLAGAAGDDGWWRGPVTVTLACDDATSGVGEGSVHYALDGGASAPYEGPFEIRAEGATGVFATCVDVAGNVARAVATVRIDTGAPSGFVGVERLALNGSVASWEAFDGTAGLRRVVVERQDSFGALGEPFREICSLEASGTAAAGDCFDAAPPGIACYRIRVVDAAGNAHVGPAATLESLDGTPEAIDPGCAISVPVPAPAP